MSPVRLIALVLFLLTVLLFSPVRHFEFINFDDPIYVTENPHVQAGLTAEGLAWAFGNLHGEDTYWHPVTWVSHMIDCELFGVEPGAHHIMNVLLHAIVALLLFHLLCRMTGTTWRSAIVAALFAWHPLQVDTVAWVTERKNILAALFWVLTMLAYLRYAERSTPARYALVLICFALGLMSKPVLVTLPGVLLLFDLWPLRRVHANELKGSKISATQIPAVSWKRVLVEKIPLLFLSLISAIVTLVGHVQLGTTISAADFPLSSRVANAIVSYVRYLSKTIWPTDLSVYYPMSKLTGWQVASSLLVVVAVTTAAVLARKRAPYLLIGWLWFLCVSLPTIGLVQASTQAMADRFAYLPLIGVFMVMVWVADDYFMKFQRRRTLSIVAATGVLIAFSAVTWGQLGYWHDSISLFTHALAVTKENPVAENNLGTALDTAGQHEEALKHFVKSIRIKPRNPQAYNNLGNVLDDLGRSDEALAAYEQALKLRPNTVLVHNNLGVVLAKLGRYDEARTNFLCAMNLKPRDAQAYYLMGTLYLRMGDARAAVNAFETALQTNPEHLKALAYLARLFAASDDPSIRNAPQAVAFSEKAVALTARAQPALLDTAAMAYAEAGRFDDALKTEQAAVDLLKNANETNAVNEILPRVALFQARQPYRENCTNLIAATTRHESR